MNAKKILAIVVAFALCVSAFAMVASAQTSTISQASTDLPGGEGMPNYTSFIDFKDWGADQLGVFQGGGADGETTWSIVTTIDENGLMTMTGANDMGYVAYFAPGTAVDAETPGVTTCIKENGFAAPSDSTTNGVAFYVDLSGWASEGNPENESVKLYFNDGDYKEDGSARLKAGVHQSTTWIADATVPAGFKGWVKVPFADFTRAWDSVDENGYVDLANLNWFMLYPNGQMGDTTFKIGKIGFYGPALGKATFVKGEATDVPESASIIIDPANVKTDDDNNSGFLQNDDTGVCSIKDGMIDVFQPATSGGWWFQKQLAFWALDDETGARVAALDGFTTKLDKTYDTTSSKAGICYFIDASELQTGDFWLDLYLQEYEVTDGATIKKGGLECKTAVHGGDAYHTYIPAGFKGWVMIPFSALSDAKWGDANTDIDNEDHIFDAEYISNMTFVASVYKSDGGEAADTEGWGFKIGKVGIWGEGTAKTQPSEDKPAEKEDDNPGTGMNAATGIASGLAIAALAVAAAACLKKND